MNDNNRRSRRDFIKDIGRMLFLGAVVTGAGALITKPAKKIENCISDGICNKCGSISDCVLPQALSTKQGMSRKQQ